MKQKQKQKQDTNTNGTDTPPTELILPTSQAGEKTDENNTENATNTTKENGQDAQPGTSTDIPFSASKDTAKGHDKGPCVFQMEKPKMPKFADDVREFLIFKADFKHLVEARYSKRDAITILRVWSHLTLS